MIPLLENYLQYVLRNDPDADIVSIRKVVDAIDNCSSSVELSANKNVHSDSAMFVEQQNYRLYIQLVMPPGPWEAYTPVPKPKPMFRMDSGERNMNMLSNIDEVKDVANL